MSGHKLSREMRRDIIHEIVQRLQVGDAEHAVGDADLGEALKFADDFGSVAGDKVPGRITFDLCGIF